jgi:hypothetical protein
MKLGSDPVPVLDALLEAEFLEALRPIEPAGAHAAAMRTKILGEIAAARECGDILTVARADGAWRPVAPGVSLKALAEAAGMRAFMLRMEAGATLPAHDHPTNEESIVLEGHGVVRAETACLIYVRTGGGKAAALL